jgi:hypothetical protein
VWVAAHSDDLQFAQEDARIVTSLSQFAAAAVQIIHTVQAKHELEERARLSAERELERLEQESRRIAVLMAEREQTAAAIQRELNDTRLLRDVAGRMIGSNDSAALFEAILDAALVITQADAGTIQLLDTASQSLTFLATRGFDSNIIEPFCTRRRLVRFLLWCRPREWQTHIPPLR